MDVTEKLQSTLTVKLTKSDLEDREKDTTQDFDAEFIYFSNIIVIQAHSKHDT